MMYVTLFWSFFKIGAFTIGGGYAMLPLIQAEVEARGWLEQEELVNFLAVSESTPGPLAVNIATYVGMETGGLPGAFSATLGVVLPSFLIILAVSQCFERFKNSRLLQGCMSGLKPAVIGLIAAAAVSVGETVFFPAGAAATPDLAATGCLLGLFVLLLFLVFKRKMNPIAVIALSAFLGILIQEILATL